MFSQPILQPLISNLLPARDPALRVALAGSDILSRAGLSTTLGAYDDCDVFEVEHLRDARSADIVVLDGDSAEVEPNGTPVIALVPDAAAASDAIANGARAVLPRGASPRRIHAALQAVSEGLVVIDDELADGVLPHHTASVSLIEPLTARELEVLQLLAAGLTNKEIAQRLGISDHTVKFHVNGILGKLGAETRTEAVVHAAKLGIVVL